LKECNGIKGSAYIVFVGNPAGRKPPGKPEDRLEDYITIFSFPPLHYV
jgi:hypothetical protein